MWKKKVPEEDSIPNELLDEVMSRILPQVKEIVNDSVKQHISILTEKLKHDIGTTLVQFGREIEAIRGEVNEVKQVSGLSIDRVIRELIAAQSFAIAKQAAKEVLDSIGMEKIRLIDSYITDIETHINDLVSSISSATEELSTVFENVQEIREDLHSEQKELSKLRKSVQDYVSSLNKEVEKGISSAVEEIRESFKIDHVDASGMLRESIEAIFREKMSEIEEKIYEATANIQHIAESVSGLAIIADKFDAIEAALESLTREVKNLRSFAESSSTQYAVKDEAKHEDVDDFRSVGIEFDR